MSFVKYYFKINLILIFQSDYVFQSILTKSIYMIYSIQKYKRSSFKDKQVKNK